LVENKLSFEQNICKNTATREMYLITPSITDKTGSVTDLLGKIITLSGSNTSSDNFCHLTARD